MHVTVENLREVAESAAYEEQAVAFASIVLRNGSVRAVLERLAGLDGLPPWYLTAGSLFQTVWNAAAGREDLREGIRDHDLFFFDEDTSWEAEDVVIKRCLAAVEGRDVELEPRNQARVHLWYPEKWGKEIAPYRDLPHAISSFAATSCCVGLSLDEGGRLEVYSTHGFGDLFPSGVAAEPVDRRAAGGVRRQGGSVDGGVADVDEAALGGAGGLRTVAAWSVIRGGDQCGVVVDLPGARCGEADYAGLGEFAGVEEALAFLGLYQVRLMLPHDRGLVITRRAACRAPGSRVR